MGTPELIESSTTDPRADRNTSLYHRMEKPLLPAKPIRSNRADINDLLLNHRDDNRTWKPICRRVWI
jgi:hypothetical protein